MNDLICSNCGIRTVNGNWGFCDECEQELIGAEIIDDPEGV